MAYITADRTREIKKELKAKFPNLTFSVRREHYTSVDVAIMSGDIDFSDILEGRKHTSINHYHIDRMYPTHAQLFSEMLEIINKGNWNRSDLMSDYHDVGFYVNVGVGKWDKPYQLTTKEA